MKRLQGMELFVEVAKTRSFSRAAIALGVPKSTLSRQVAELEQSVGLRLLSRTTRKVELTDAGRLYFERCQRIVAEAQIAHEELRNMVDTPSGPLRVNMPADFGTDFLAECFMEFSQRYPDVTFFWIWRIQTMRNGCFKPAISRLRLENCPTRRKLRGSWACCQPTCTRLGNTWKNTGNPLTLASWPGTNASNSGQKAPGASRAGHSIVVISTWSSRQATVFLSMAWPWPEGWPCWVPVLQCLWGANKKSRNLASFAVSFRTGASGRFRSMPSPKLACCPPRPESSSSS